MSSLLTFNPWVFAVAIALLLAAGVWGYQAWVARASQEPTMKIPSPWPVRVRALVNRNELRVWRWLRKAFPEFHVMIKLPVTRFTLPRDPAMAEQLHQQLGNVYCTFTLCNGQGRVIGCVDVEGRRVISPQSFDIKQSLLTQCGLGYALLNDAQLPTTDVIRKQFLGLNAGDAVSEVGARESADEGAARAAEAPVVSVGVADEPRLIEVQANLRSTLSRQRQSREHSEFGSLSSFEIDVTEERDLERVAPNSAWGANSFLHSLDSRKGELT